MSFSNISATQRQQQEEALKKILAISLLASTILHGVALPLSLKLVKPAEFADDAIEIVMLDEPKVEETKSEPAIQEKVSPPPETFKPEPPPEPIPPEEQPVAAMPPPIPEEQPVAATPPPIPKEPPVAATPPPIPKEPPVATTPPPIPEEPPVAATPPPIPEEPSAIAPKQDFNPPETAKTPIANEPKTPSPDPPKNDSPSTTASEQPPKSEPPVTASRPKGAGSSADFTADAGNPKSSDSPEKNNSPSPSATAGSSSPSDEPLNPASGPIQRDPAAGPPVAATRPGGSRNSGNAIGDITNPSSSDSPGGGSPASESKISSDEPFGAGSGPIPRDPAAGPPVTATRPGGGRNSGNAIGDVTNPSSSDSPGGGSPASESEISSSPFGSGSGPLARTPQTGPPVTATRPGGGRNSGNAIGDARNPIGSPSNSASGGIGSGGGLSSEPFGSGSGAVPKPTNPGGGGSPSRPSGPPPGTCISCGKPEYPSSARKEGRQGQVQVKFDVDPNGKAFNIAILTSSNYDDFDRAAIKTVEKWKFASSESVIQGKIASITFRLNE